jgi:hypothetical protein
MRALIALFLGLALPHVGLAQQSEDSCRACHGGLTGALAEPVRRMAEDIHSIKGFGCVACHGGDATELGMGAMDPQKGYIGVPGREDIISVCGRCHSDAEFMKRYNPSLRVDQVAEYRTSVHGHRLFESQDTLVATCIGCHPAHSIKPPSEPSSSVNPLNVAATCTACHGDAEYMQAYGIPTDQHRKYEESIHWQMLSVERDMSAPTCNDCHGNHGAAPPGVSWVGNVCGQCHAVMSDLFAKSFHAQVFAMLGNPGCATCHGNHAVKRAGDELLGLGKGAVCATCHAEGDNGGMAAAEMRTLIDSLNASDSAADSILRRAEHAGMEVSDARFELNDAITALVSARTAVHSFDVAAVRDEVATGLEVTSQAHARGEEALTDLQFRRLGLAVSVGIIVLLIVGLVMKIKQLEARRAHPREAS